MSCGARQRSSKTSALWGFEITNFEPARRSVGQSGLMIGRRAGFWHKLTMTESQPFSQNDSVFGCFLYSSSHTPWAPTPKHKTHWTNMSVVSSTCTYNIPYCSYCVNLKLNTSQTPACQKIGKGWWCRTMQLGRQCSLHIIGFFLSAVGLHRCFPCQCPYHSVVVVIVVAVIGMVAVWGGGKATELAVAE